MRADGAKLAGAGRAGLLLPAGPKGPGFLVFRNFDAIYAYNHHDSYALAVSHLADRLAGHPALRTRWPTDDPGLSQLAPEAMLALVRGMCCKTPFLPNGPTQQIFCDEIGKTCR